MLINKKLLLLALVIYGFMGIVYYYYGRIIPFELTVNWLWLLLIISFLLTPFVIGLTVGKVLPEEYQENKALSCFIHLLFFGYIAHNLIWTIFIFAFRGTYEDKGIYYPNIEDKRGQIITQYKDQGAMGGHYRKIKAYELTPFLRYVERVDYK
jgi:hypothetical protein